MSYWSHSGITISGVWSHSGSLEAGVTPESRVWSLESLRSLESGVTGAAPEDGGWSLELRSIQITGYTYGLDSAPNNYSLESGVTPESRVWSLESLRSLEAGAVTPESGGWSLELLRSLECGVWIHSGA